MTENHIDTRDALITTDLGPEQQLITAPMYNPAPLPVTAEQYTIGKTSMNLVKMVAVSTNYAVTPAVTTAQVQSYSDSSKMYVVHDTDWVVIGPNLETVYTNTQFTALYATASGNTMSFSIGPTSSDPMTVQLIAYIGGAAGTLDIDWGDGSTHATPSVVVGVNPSVTHTYSALGTYPIWVVYKVSGTTVSSQPGTFLAKPPPDYSSIGTGTDAPGMGAHSAPSGPSAMSLSAGTTGVIASNNPNTAAQYMSNVAAADSSAALAANAGGWVGVVGTMSDGEKAELDALMGKPNPNPPAATGPMSPI